jgi:hypothetical protein
MKSLIVFSDVTVDGFMAGPDNDLDFMVDDPQLEDELTGMLMSVADTIVVGRKAFPDMAAYWTTADGAVAADYLRDRRQDRDDRGQAGYGRQERAGPRRRNRAARARCRRP